MVLVQSFQKSTFRRDVLILCGLWLLVAGLDRYWILIDQAPPAWDQGDHLTRALNHWWVLQTPHWLSADWWRTLWQQAPTQRAPLVALLTVPLFAMWGASMDVGLGVNLIFSAVLLGSTYALGRRLFSSQVGLWAAGFSLLAPTLFTLRLDYLLDYALVATVTVTLTGLTYWWTAQRPSQQWGFTGLWGVGIALMLLTRTSGLLFIVALLGWPTLLSLWGRRWGRLVQLGAGLGLGLLLIWPWFSASWLTIISTTIESTAHGVIYRRDPQANTLAGWLYYPRQLPAMVSSPILFLGLAVGLLALVKKRRRGRGERSHSAATAAVRPAAAWLWLGGIVLLILVLGALGSNKQPRLLAPLVPPLLVLLAALWGDRPQQPWAAVQWLAAAIAAGLMLWTLFPLPGAPLNRNSYFPYEGTVWPNDEIVAAMAQSAPYQTSTLGMAVNTQQLNPANMDFYGGSANFQVFARQLAWNPDTAGQDAQALDWYLTKSGDQGAYETIEAGQAFLKEAIVTSPDLAVQATWPLPDGSEAQLYHRRQPQVTVMPTDAGGDSMQLVAVNAPEQVVPGQGYPITYRVVGPWTSLQGGLLLLTWQPDSGADSGWIGDHAVGLGRLYGDHGAETFVVEERLALVPPTDLTEGRYRLTAELLQPATGQVSAVSVSPTEIQVQPRPLGSAPSGPAMAPPLDLVTYLRQLSQSLAEGNVDPIFADVGRINQYDPRQSYLVHAEQALGYRLQQSPDRTDWLYGKLLAQVLQQKAGAAIATLNTLTTIAPDNPYHWLYLGFVHLYAWQPRGAQAALDQAMARNPDLPNLRLLQGVAAAMQLRLPQAIALFKAEGVL